MRGARHFSLRGSKGSEAQAACDEDRTVERKTLQAALEATVLARKSPSPAEHQALLSTRAFHERDGVTV